MKIFVLTPIYATATTSQGATPVVHYFTREWAKAGHQVTVFHLDSKFPRPLYWISRKFQHRLSTHVGYSVPLESPREDDYEVQGVTVHRRCLKKVIPHSLYSNKQLGYALDCIEKECEQNGTPDWFIGHWDNPQLELLCELKKRFNKPICIVLHSNVFNYEAKYGKRWLEMLAQLDVIGFRSPIGLANFEKKYGKPKRSFIASSGVSQIFLDEGAAIKKEFCHPIHNFVFVGSLIARKHPATIITALSQAYPDGDFKITYIGDGAEKEVIESEHRRLGDKGEVVFTGRIPREEIIPFLKDSDVFVMVSKDEIFGLVYLEAMAMGLIPIGSKNEGIDGIIRNGENGFLCEAGNVSDLANALERIKSLPKEQLQLISDHAKETAREYSDNGVAEKYIQYLEVFQIQMR